MKPEEISQNVLHTLEQAWNNANGSEFAKPFAGISEFVDIRGTFHQNVSPQYIGEAHQELFMSIYKGSDITYKLLHAISIDTNTILVNATTELNTPSGPLSGINNSMITLILTNTDDHWKIRAFQNTLVLKH